MSNRIKLSIAAPRTREEMESLVGEIAALKIREATLKAAMDKRLQEVREDFALQLAEVADQLGIAVPKAMAWAEDHSEAFAGAKSIEMLHGTIGWRTNNPSVKPRSGWTWSRVLEVLWKRWSGYVRVKVEVDKQALLADRHVLEAAGALKEMGVRVIQEDEFFVDPKITETETRAVAGGER